MRAIIGLVEELIQLELIDKYYFLVQPMIPGKKK